MVARAFATSPFANQKGAISPRSTPVSGCSTSREAGPGSAISAYRLLESIAATSPTGLICSLIQAKSLAVFDALTTIRKWIGAMR